MTNLLATDVSDDVKAFVYDLAAYAIDCYASDENYTDDVSYLTSLLEGKSLTSANGSLFSDMSAINTDSSYFTEVFGKISVNDFGAITIAIPQDFSGKLKISVGDYETVYDISLGKYGNAREISLILPTNLIFKELTLKAYDSNGTLLAKEGETLSGTFSISEWTKGLTDGGVSALKKGIAIRFGIAQRDAD